MREPKKGGWWGGAAVQTARRVVDVEGKCVGRLMQ